ncbi:hypothetical protein BD413DRAFT_28265 [Trametes elegans]|nr:hypothetical protein BD413DRAFT_28265 [Trametes elegans]
MDIDDELPTAYIDQEPLCAHCGKTEAELKTKLKRCAGCGVAMYCTKECQKTAWPVHKRKMSRKMCRSADSLQIGAQWPSRFGGYTAPIALANAVKVFAGDAHPVAFSLIANSVVILNGGPEANLGSPAKALLFRLAKASKEDMDSGNPARAFKLLDATVRDRAALTHLVADNWVSATAECEAVEARIRRETQHPTFAGVLPAVFLVVDTGVIAHHHFPVHRVSHRPAAQLDDGERAIFEDVIEMCRLTLNRGYVLHDATDAGKYQPEVGTWVKRKKKWEWERTPGWNWNALKSEQPGGFKSAGELRPGSVWVPFRIMLC